MTDQLHPLRKARQDRKLTQIELSTLAGVSQQVIHQIETGKTKNPSAAKLMALAKALKMPVEKLVAK